ncbi:MAG: 30S ribosomal protein S17 [Candidatus ainarchaeum sp.]|nr:30S ribosomal protein S17 [Candidatus ainarchaeum sp.]
MVEKKEVAKKSTKAKKIVEVSPKNEKIYSVRGNIFQGKVVSAKSNKTITVERDIIHYVSKYERYKKVKSRIHVHNPESINAKEGDIVKIGQTRKISKTKSFIVIEIIKKAGDAQ